MSISNCIIIPGCADDENDHATHRFERTKRDLIEKGVPTDVCYMPKTWQPDYSAYAETFAKYHVDEHTVLVGHSCGCAFLARWLGETQQKIAKLFLVAPRKIADEESPVHTLFYEYPVDTTIRERVGEVAIFTSNDEEEEGKESAAIFHDALGGEIISLPDHGHYDILSMGTEEFPELVEEILA